MEDEMTTLRDAVAGWLDHQERKHDMAPGYAERYINALTPYEFLEHLSEALERAGAMVADDGRG
jgi:hypothetical protein